MGYLPAETGEYIHFVVQNWLAWELTQSAFYLGLLGFCEFAPRFIFGPIGGVIADRMDRLKLLKLSRVANLLQSLVFAFLVFSGLLEYWHIVVLVVFMAIVSSFSTAAQQVVVVNLVPQDERGERARAALGDAQPDQSHRPVHRRRPAHPHRPRDPACWFSPRPSFACSLRSSRCAQRRRRPAWIKGRWLTDIVEGVSYLRRNRRLFATILTTYSNGFFGISYSQFLPYFAQEVLRVGPSGTA
jgi:hypothetical protein